MMAQPVGTMDDVALGDTQLVGDTFEGTQHETQLDIGDTQHDIFFGEVGLSDVPESPAGLLAGVGSPVPSPQPETHPETQQSPPSSPPPLVFDRQLRSPSSSALPSPASSALPSPSASPASTPRGDDPSLDAVTIAAIDHELLSFAQATEHARGGTMPTQAEQQAELDSEVDPETTKLLKQRIAFHRKAVNDGVKAT